MIESLKLNCINLLPIELSGEITDYEVLCKINKIINELIDDVNKIIEVVDPNSNAIKELQNCVNYLNSELVKISNGEYMEIYIEALSKWIDTNLQEIVSKIVKQVFFGLEGDYFIAYIPESWEDITFDTGNLCDSEEWGHLILTY